MNTPNLDGNTSIIPTNTEPLPLDKSKVLRPKDMVDKILERKRAQEAGKKKDPLPPFKLPKDWKSNIEKNSTKPLTTVLYLSRNRVLSVKVVKPEEGNLLVIKDNVHELDPRCFLNINSGKNSHPVLMIKEIDRSPVTTLAVEEQLAGRENNSDFLLLKAAIRDIVPSKEPKKIPTWVKWIIGIIVVAGVIYYFTQGNSGGVNAAADAAGTVLP